MCIGKPVSTITRQRVLIIRGSILIVEPSLVPILRMTMKFGVREADVLPFLNGDAAKFSVGPVYKFSTMVQIEKIPEQFNSWLFLQIGLTKHLKVANIRHRVGSNISRVDLEARKHITEKLGSGRFKTTVHVINKYHYLAVFWGRRIF